MSTDSRFILAPELQENFISKYDGLPIVGGYIFFWDDLNRTVPKPVYMQSGSPPDYSYIELPNPVRLGASGSPVDNDGNSIVIFYFPYQGTPLIGGSDGSIREYYIEVFDSGLRPEFTRAGFPPNVSAQTPALTSNNFLNLVPNGSFYFNIGQSARPIPDETTAVAASVDHGTDNHDIYLVTDVSSADDQITFTRFPLGNSPIVDTLPAEYYFNYTCYNIPTGETFKNLWFPITPGVNNLNNTQVTVSFWARSLQSNTLQPVFLQEFGDGGGSASVTTNISPSLINLINTWARYGYVITIPSTAGKTIGACGNDALLLGFELELNAINNTDIAQVQVLSGNQTGTDYMFQPQAYVSSYAFGPRTGEVKSSIRQDVFPGWLLMDDGTIGDASSHATSRANIDTFNLFSFIWQLNTAYAPIFTSSGVLSSKTTVVADFIAHKQIALTKQLGRVISGANPNAVPFKISLNANAVSNNLICRDYDTSSLFLGTVIQFVIGPGGVLPAGLSAAVNYYVIPVSSTLFQVASTLENAYAGAEINITTAGTMPFYSTIIPDAIEAGQFLGEAAHRLIADENVDHKHATSFYASNITSGALAKAPDQNYDVGNTQGFTGPITPDALNLPFNIIQPTSYYNIYIKL